MDAPPPVKVGESFYAPISVKWNLQHVGKNEQFKKRYKHTTQSSLMPLLCRELIGVSQQVQ
jgi:hypothetical protein